MRLLQCGVCPEPFKSSHFPASVRVPCVGPQAGFIGWMVVAARQGSNGELSGWPDGEQLAGAGWKARSAQRWCSSDLLHLLRGKLSQKVFISWQTRLWLDSYTTLDLWISDKNLEAELTSAVKPGFFSVPAQSHHREYLRKAQPCRLIHYLKGTLCSLGFGSRPQHHLLERVHVDSKLKPDHLNCCSNKMQYNVI